MPDASILIVEDEVIVAEDLTAKLNRLGYAVVGRTAYGEQALTLTRDLHPHLVLMDIRLAGGMDGVTAAETIHRECDVPVIYLTAHSDYTTLERAKLTEPFGFMLKPFEERELSLHIEMALYKYQAERKLRKLNRTLRALTHHDQALLHATDEAAFLTEVCRIIVEDCGHPLVWVGYAEDNEAKSVRPVAYSGFDAGYLDTMQLTWADTERCRGPTGTAIRTAQVCVCRNMQSDPAFQPWRNEAIRRGFAASIALPLIQDGKAFGALTIYFREPDPLTEDEVKQLTDLAHECAYGISALRLRVENARIQAERERLSRSNEILHADGVTRPAHPADDYQRACLPDAGTHGRR